jgi:hypothetical protein
MSRTLIPFVPPQVDNDGYLAACIAFILALKPDPKAQLPPFHLHLTDVGGFLRAAAGTDIRLAALFPRGAATMAVVQQQQQGMGLGPGQSQGVRAAGGGGDDGGGRLMKRGAASGGGAGAGFGVGRRPRLGEFLGQQKWQPYFKLQDSPVSKGHRCCDGLPLAGSVK